MPRKIKVLWIVCILVAFFGFIYFSIQDKFKVHRDKEEARVKQEFRIKKKQMALKEVDRGQTFKVDPIKEIRSGCYAQPEPIKNIYMVGDFLG